MPLSEDDQRIFREIEQTFYEHDPEFAKRVADPPDAAAVATRNMKLGAVGLVVGLIALVLLLPVNPIASFCGFAVMVASGYVVVDNARRAGKIKLSGFNDAMMQRRESLGGARERMRRTRNDEE